MYIGVMHIFPARRENSKNRKQEGGEAAWRTQ